MDTQLTKDLLALEKQYWQAIKDKDVDAALRLTDETCIVAGAQGIGSLDKKSLGAMMKSASYKINDFKLSDDVAILAYKVHEELTVDGKPVSLDASDASTWVLRENRWVCALHTESILGDPFGRDRQQRAA